MEILNIFQKLISFNTISSRSNLILIDYVRDLLSKYNCESHLIFNEDKTKANLFATIGERKDGGIAFSGHTDVVPTEGQKWNSDPFELTLSANKLIGRGTCDMKGFIACVLHKLPEMTSKPLATPIHFAFSFDEEVGCLGAPLMINQIGKTLPTPSLAWVGEPTMLKSLTAHKSNASLNIEIIGEGAHSSNPKAGVSAIYYGNKIINHTLKESSEREEKQLSDIANKNSEFQVPTDTIHIGKITGGIARNIIAPNCTLEIGIRCLPNSSSDEIIDNLKQWCLEHVAAPMQKISKSCDVKFNVLNKVPSFQCNINSPEMRWLLSINPDIEFDTASYVTEAGQFAKKIPTLICGPGSVEQAHQANEWVDAEQIEKTLGLLDKIIESSRIGIPNLAHKIN